MRINEPVTNQEIRYSDSQKIVSTTNAKGVIEDVNDDFLEISGFTKKELIGQAHNIVRHPSMPQVAFAELWDHNKQNKPWMGMVKNRCKNGDHYWVDAFVTPIVENGEVTGYQSVRQNPKREWVDRAEQLYSNNKPLVSKLCHLWHSIPLNGRLFIGFSVVSLISFAFYLLTQLALLALSVSIIGNALLGWLYARPLIAFAKQTKTLFDSSIAQQLYTNRLDELGQLQLALKFLESQKDTILHRTLTVSNRVKSNAEDAYQISQTTKADIEEMYKQIELAATATHEMSMTIQEVAENSSVTSSSADESKNNVNIGCKILSDARIAIDDLVKAINESSSIIQTLSENSSKIGTVVDVISGIAEQTNLLALNAAIEAARAGEQGRGFAVVADEVRALAAKTQESTGQISEMISTLQHGASNAVSSISSSHEQVNISVESIKNLNAQFETMLSNVDTISDMCIQIATATEEQSMVAEEINQNITSIKSVGDKTLESTDIVNRSNKSLLDAASSMNNMVNQFK